MLKTKPIEIIATLSQDELKDMSAFIRSPYFNTNRNLVKLFDTVKKEIRKIQAGAISEENVYTRIFPGKKYNYGIMKNLVSSLAALCDEFLILNSIRRGPVNQVRNRVQLADEYDSRRLDQYYAKAIHKVEARLDTQPMDNFYYPDRMLAEESKYFFYSSRSDYRGLENAIYNEMIYTLCDFYRRFSRNMWKININMDNVNSKYEMDFIEILNRHIAFEKLAEELKGFNEREYNFIRLNTLLIKLLVNTEDTKPYYELKQLLYDTIDNYDNYERYSILTKAVSYCSTAYRMRKREFMRESIDMRMLIMEKVRFNYRGLGPFSFHYFIETLTMLIHENDVSGAEVFLEKYIDVVGPKTKEISFNLCSAFIHEARGRYSEAMKVLAKTWHDNTEINLHIRRLYISVYYKMNEFEAGFDAINTFRSYVKGNGALTGLLKERYLASALAIEKIYKIRAMPEKYSRGDVEKIRKKLEKTSQIMNKWITDRLDELKGIVKA